MIINEEIDYIEVSIFDGDTETAGLMTHYGVQSRRVRLLTDSSNTNELFDLDHYTVIRIQVGKSNAEYETVEQYVFKSDPEDQKMAITIMTNQLNLLNLLLMQLKKN